MENLKRPAICNRALFLLTFWRIVSSAFTGIVSGCAGALTGKTLLHCFKLIAKRLSANIVFSEFDNIKTKVLQVVLSLFFCRGFAGDEEEEEGKEG